MNDTILVTGGAGFIGSNFVLDWFQQDWFQQDRLEQGAGAEPGEGKPGGTLGSLVNLDKLTYAGNLGNLAALAGQPGYTFVHGDINDKALVAALLEKHRPRAIVHFAAESHVDRSIAGPEAFLKTNIDGTFTLLQAALAYTRTLDEPGAFRFLHVSTDEVYGTLGPEEAAFHEETPYAPNSPYAASKAASDHLVRAWHHTYGLPTLITNCSNNYGPLHFPEKLIPLVITHALKGKALPVYGDGAQVRDWLYVRDHCSAIRAVLARGKPGETYNVGGGNQRTNLEVVTQICGLLDELRPGSAYVPHAGLIRYVADRPGHDRRYAIDARKLERELGWRAAESFETGLRKTVKWYLEHEDWVENVTSGAYQGWLEANYVGR